MRAILFQHQATNAVSPSVRMDSFPKGTERYGYASGDFVGATVNWWYKDTEDADPALMRQGGFTAPTSLRILAGHHAVWAEIVDATAATDISVGITTS